MRALAYIGAEKITFPPKPDIQTDRQTYRRTDICVYRVASLLKTLPHPTPSYPTKKITLVALLWLHIQGGNRRVHPLLQ